MPVIDNIMVSMDQDKTRPRFGLLKTIFQSNAVLENEAKKYQDAAELLSIFKLETRKNYLAKE